MRRSGKAHKKFFPVKLQLWFTPYTGAAIPNQGGSVREEPDDFSAIRIQISDGSAPDAGRADRYGAVYGTGCVQPQFHPQSVKTRL